MAETKKLFMLGTQARYDALESYDSSTLYFTSDTKKIFKGSEDYTESVVIVKERPATPAVGKVYFIDPNFGETVDGTKTSAASLETYINGKWVVLNYEVVGSISSIDESIVDKVVPSVKAVKEYVDNSAVGIAQGTEAGTLDYTTASGTTPVVVPGVALKPIYDSSLRKITIPVTATAEEEATNVEINLGKDIYIDPTAENGYNASTKTIDLYLNDGTEGKEATKISIPAASLIDVYTGETTSSAKVEVSDDNKISVNIVLASDGGLKIATDGGVAVDFDVVASKAYVEEVIENLASTIGWGEF
jgi:hypothetical protein